MDGYKDRCLTLVAVVVLLGKWLPKFTKDKNWSHIQHCDRYTMQTAMCLKSSNMFLVTSFAKILVPLESRLSKRFRVWTDRSETAKWAISSAVACWTFVANWNVELIRRRQTGDQA